MPKFESMTYFRRQIFEIQNSKVLSLYGGLLCFCYLYFWIYLYQYGFDFKLSYLDEPICWPFFKSCDSVRIFSQNSWQMLFLSLSVLSIANAILFFKNKIRLAYLLAIGLECARIAVILFDYRVRLNQNYMFTFVILAFLFIGKKTQTIPRLLVLFYFWAGFLKLNKDWLSGLAIYGDLLFIPESLKGLSAQYVVFLEIIMSPFLLVKNRIVKYSVLFQLLMFHLISLSVVGFFYPALMLTLLLIFVLVDYYDLRKTESNFVVDKIASCSLLVLFSVLNFYPYFVPGDKTLTGETRLISLHMFDSITYCNAWAVSRYKDKEPQKKNLFMPNVIRIRCDPIVYLSRLRKICQDGKSDVNFTDVDFTLDVRKGNSERFTSVVDISNFCSKDYSYSVWGRNDWIRID